MCARSFGGIGMAMAILISRGGDGWLVRAAQPRSRNDNGAFALHVDHAHHRSRYQRVGLAWGDADGDGDLDLATANTLTPANPGRLYYNNWKHGWDTP